MEESIERTTYDRQISSPERSPDGERRSANRELFETHATIKARLDAEKREKSIEKTTKPTLSSRTPSRTFDYPIEHEHTPDHEELPVQTDEHFTTSTSSDKPSYMSHTVCSLEHIRRDHSVSRSNSKKIPQSEVSPYPEQPEDSSPNGSSKFGVELKRLNSNPSQIIGRRKSSSSEIPHIEEIFELELLEKMLETVIGYEQRRRIRSQIRIVKKQQPAVLETTSRKSYHPTVHDYRTVKNQPRESASPVRKTAPTSRPIENVNIKMSPTTVSQAVPKTVQPSKAFAEDELDYSKRTPVIEAPMIRKLSYKLGEDSNDHVARISESKSVRKTSPNSKSTSTVEDNFSSVNLQNSRTTNKHNSPTSSNVPRRTSRSPSPKTKTSHTTKPVKIQQTSQKISNPVASEPGKPIWATQNILKKASETSTRTFKSSSTTAKKTVTKVQKQKTIENIEDCVTSSYGIGPTDEDGMPLFGIRALKKKSQPIQSTTKG